MNNESLLQRLQAHWSGGGVFYEMRHGVFHPDKANDVVAVLREIDFGKDGLFYGDVIRAVWGIPTFIIANKNKCVESGGATLKEVNEFFSRAHQAISQKIHENV